MGQIRESLERDFEPLFQMLQRDGHDINLKKARQIYANRDVNLQHIDAIGFDMDYTLALYRQEAMDALSVEKTLERLIKHRGYPTSILQIKPNPDFAIRGLVIDKKRGDILKLDVGRHVIKVFHGFRELKQPGRYHHGRPSIRIDPRRYHLIDTLFALPEAYLYAAIIEHFEIEHGGMPVSYEQLFEDIRFSIDMAHRDGSLKTEIMANLEKYIIRDDRMGATLHKMRAAGKKLFLMTNSGLPYTDAVMTYLLDGQLPAYASWRDYFDLTITTASKPVFFSGRKPFLILDDDNHVIGQSQGQLLPDLIYQGGNLQDFEEFTGWSCDRVLYVGDHIYGDILKSKKTSSWRTCLLIQEMPEEMEYTARLGKELGEALKLESDLYEINERLIYEHHLLHRIQEIISSQNETSLGGEDESAKQKELHDACARLRQSSQRLHEERQKLIGTLSDLDQKIESGSNPFWGLIFKAGNENSIVASQVELYADLYTSTVSNFFSYAPNHEFRSPRSIMPHEF